MTQVRQNTPVAPAKYPAGVVHVRRSRNKLLAALHPNLKLAIEYVPPASLKGYARNARTHSKRQVEQIAESIRAFGFVTPLVVDRAGELIAGHGRLAAARLLGCDAVPIVRLEHLDDAQKRALRIADNHLAELSGWDRQLLAIEFQDLLELDLSLDLSFDLAITGFSSPEIDQLIEGETGALAEAEPEEIVPEVDESRGPMSRLGDLWVLGEHRLICGDAREAATYAALLGEERAAMGIHDAPYDVPISGAKRGGRRELIIGAGELGASFRSFLTSFLKASTGFLVPGGYQYCFMDWRHIGEMLGAGHDAGIELKNLCVWNKGSGAMGPLYRSQHELVFIFKEPSAPGSNNVQLGKFGRNRTNVWDHPGVVSSRKELELHPTPKPVALVADAIRDVSNRGDIVLDAFSGSGTAIIAAAKVGRRGYAIEHDPYYVDVGVKRWEAWSGQNARHAETGLTYAETVALRREAQAPSELVANGIIPASYRVRQRAPGEA